MTFISLLFEQVGPIGMLQKQSQYGCSSSCSGLEDYSGRGMNVYLLVNDNIFLTIQVLALLRSISFRFYLIDFLQIR